MSLDVEKFSHLIRADLENFRSVRYRSEEQALALARFDPDDRITIRELYEFLSSLEGLVEDPAAADGPEPLTGFKDRHDVPALVDRVRGLGRGTSDRSLFAPLHDIRGGALTAIFLQLARVGRVPYQPERARWLAFGTRDQMKIMRNVIVDIDPRARERDLAMIPHSLGELAAALGTFTATIGDRQVVAAVDYDGDGTIIAETCVECAAVDRVAYNLLNNAAAHTTSPAIDVWLRPHDGDLRVVVSNSISDEHAVVVERTLEEDPAALFGTFTTSGSGHGLGIVSDLVARAYGVTSADQLIARGYVGAKLVESSFVSWFHWPLSTIAAAPVNP